MAQMRFLDQKNVWIFGYLGREMIKIVSTIWNKSKDKKRREVKRKRNLRLEEINKLIHP